LLDASTDPEQLRRLFDRPAAQLIGVPTGEASGFDVLDLDYRNGAREWEIANAHRLPETRIHQTQSGGRHYLFKHVHGVRNSAGRVGPGVDVRGQGGYVVLPPSVGYSVISDADIADWPDWLLRPGVVLPKQVERPDVQPSRAPASSARMEALLQASLRAVSAAPGGQKHFTLRNHALRVGGLLHYGGFSRREALDALLNALPDTTKDRNAARKTAEWGLDNGALDPIILTDTPEWEARQQRNGHHFPPPDPRDTDPNYWTSIELDAPEIAEPILEPTPEPTRVFDPWNALRPVSFPMETLPSLLRGFVENRARIIGADPGAIAWACLSACSAAIHGGVRLRMKRHDHWSVPPALWVSLVGDPSTKKTPIISAAWEPLNRRQGDEMRGFQIRHAQWKALPKKEQAHEPEPSMTRLITHDATMEGLQEILAKQDRGIGVLRDELAGWIGSMEKYAPGKGGAADRAFALQSYNGGEHVVDRVMRGVLAINNLLATICGGIQPDRLRQFSDLTDDGLWQRFIPVVVGPGSIGEDDADERAQAYAVLIGSLLRVRADTRVMLSDGAHAVRESVQERIFGLEQSGVLGSRFVGFCGKLVGVWGRLALVLHLIESPGGNVVSPETAECARALLFRSVLPNAARVYTAMGGSGADLEATQSIAGYILTKRMARIVVSDLTSNVRVCRHRSVEDVRKLLSPLEAGGWLVPEKDFNPTSWLVNMMVHAKFSAQAEKEASRRAAVRLLITGQDDPDKPD
jgi:hypothetical protein